MEKTVFSTPETLLLVMFMTVSVGLWLQKFKVFKSLGPALTVIILGIILSNLKIVPVNHDVYGILSGYCIPPVSYTHLDVYKRQAVHHKLLVVEMGSI